MNVTLLSHEETLLSPFREGANALWVVSLRPSAAFLAHEIVRLLGKRRTKKGAASKGLSIFVIAAYTASPADTIQAKALLQLAEMCSDILSVKLISASDMPEMNLYAWTAFGLPYSCIASTACLRYEDFTENSHSLNICSTAAGFQEIARLQMLDAVKFTSPPLYSKSLRQQGFTSLELSFLNDAGTVSARSGLNWGKRFEHKRRENEAYISVPAPIAKFGYFPSGGRYFSILTDDDESFVARIEQQNDKALTTPLDNSILGLYLRRRLGIPPGAEVKTFHLQQYGRTDIFFIKLDQETYFMDFSSPTQKAN